MDVILHRTHPLWDDIQDQAAQCGGVLFPCDGAQWQAAIDAGGSEWIVLADPRSTIVAADIFGLQQYLACAETPIWLQPSTTSTAADRLIGEYCPAAISLCWNNPARYALVCVRRSSLPALPQLVDQHPDALWDWLIRSAERPAEVQGTARARIGEWMLCSTLAARHISQPSSKIGEPEHATRFENRVPTLISGAPAPELDWLIKHIHQAKPGQFAPESSRVSIADAVAVKAGLLLWHDAADESHQLSQSIEGLGKEHAGDYWHAILHRREPDYSNAKYWFRQFPIPGVMSAIVPCTLQALQDVQDGETWKKRLLAKGYFVDPFAFVDFCEACEGREDSPLGQAARQIQAAEMHYQMIMTYRDASGS